MVAVDKADRTRALRALLVVIDSGGYELKTRKQREEVVKYVIETNDLTYWTGFGSSRRQMQYTDSLLFTQFGQLIIFLKKGVQETKPKNEVLWLFGSSVIKPEYLKKHLGYDNIDLPVGNDTEESRSQTVDREEALVVPDACSYVKNIPHV